MTSKTYNTLFDREGYLVVKTAYEKVEELVEPIPEKRLRQLYTTSGEILWAEEPQVPGSASRYNYPDYRKVHSYFRRMLEQNFGKKLYPTYYYDRFYFPGQELTPHTDRGSCEISVSLNIGTNLKGNKAKWPFWIEMPSGEKRSIICEPGDAIIYKGCECLHWREPMPRPTFNFRNKEIYYHQAFFHYVLQDGDNAHHAWDATPDY